MAVVRNITPDALSVFRSEAPPCQPGDEVTVKDENFVGRAWPKSTWEVVTPPEGDYVDNDTEDAYCFVLPEPKPELEVDPDPIPPVPMPTPSRTRAKKED